MIDIVCNIDENYVEYCGVMLSSLFVHNPQEAFKIHAINSNVTLSQKKRLSEFCHVQLRTSEHRSMYSYVRLSIDRCTATYV